MRLRASHSTPSPMSFGPAGRYVWAPSARLPMKPRDEPLVRVTLSELRAWGEAIAQKAAGRAVSEILSRGHSLEIEREPAAVTTRQAAERAGVSVPTVREWIKRGQLPARNVGGRGGYRISAAALDAFLEGRPR